LVPQRHMSTPHVPVFARCLDAKLAARAAKGVPALGDADTVSDAFYTVATLAALDHAGALSSPPSVAALKAVSDSLEGLRCHAWGLLRVWAKGHA
jgi:hypothetical protein